jgi:phosphotransferase system, enzyme I, PtsP
MEPGGLSVAVEREASLFEREADLEGFLERMARSITGNGDVAACGIYLADRGAGGLALRASAGAAGALPAAADVRDPIAGATAGQQAVRVQAAGGVTRLILPISRGPYRLGALVVDARGEIRAEVEGELRAVAARLGSILENATVLLGVRPEGGHPGGARVIRGEAASAGVATGTALPFASAAGFAAEGGGDGGTAGPDALEHFDRAMDLTRGQIQGLLSDGSSQLADVVELIFSAHLLMLNDDSFTGAMRRLVREGKAPGAAVSEVVTRYAQIFGAMSEARLAEKAQDVRDIGYRLQRNLSSPGGEQGDYRGRIVLAGHVYPSDLVRLAVQHAEGVVLLGTAVTAHVAILARSLSFPVLITHDRSLLEIAAETPLVLDATRGELHVNVGSAAPVAAGPVTTADTVAAGSVVTETRDGARVLALANVNLYKDAQLAAAVAADGIGLYRSEFLFIIRNDFLSEEEQVASYRRIVDSMPGREITLRTADIGGDKLMEGRGEAESNPFLGVRGIRFSLANRVLFREQLRAMMRAGVGRELRILLPMVSSLEEIEEAREEIEACRVELQARGVAHNPRPMVGAMVELPSAVMGIEDLAAATDFLSIGTNDLIMYLLAVDRTNERLSRMYRSHHPTVLRSLALIARGVGPRLDQLSVCGDSAADPLMVPFLIGIGIRRLSVAPQKLADLRCVVRALSAVECERIAGEMLALRTVRGMDGYLAEMRRQLEPTRSAT